MASSSSLITLAGFVIASFVWASKLFLATVKVYASEKPKQTVSLSKTIAANVSVSGSGSSLDFVCLFDSFCHLSFFL